MSSASTSTCGRRDIKVENEDSGWFTTVSGIWAMRSASPMATMPDWGAQLPRGAPARRPGTGGIGTPGPGPGTPSPPNHPAADAPTQPPAAHSRRTRTNERPRQRGFTLIELLVALFIAAIMFAMGYGAINQALKNHDTLRSSRRTCCAADRRCA